jgi:hypothetical protein
LKSFQKNKKSFCKFLRFLVKYIPCLNQPKPRTTAYRVFSYASVNTHRVWETPIECEETPVKRVETPSSVKRVETPVKRVETPIERVETHIERGETSSSVGNITSSVWKHTSSVGKHHRAWGSVGVYRGVAEACGTLGTRGRGAWGGVESHPTPPNNSKLLSNFFAIFFY